MEEAQAWLDETSSSMEEHMIVVATPEDIRQGRALLDKISSTGERLRIFIIETFKIEEVL